MKISAIILLLLVPMVTVAQNYQGMNEGDMQKMRQQMQKMETCMQNVDQAKLKELEQRSKQFEAEVKSLCEIGKRDKAQEKTISYGKEIAKDPTMQTMRKCSEMMKGMMPQMPYMDQDKDRFKDRSGDHICD
jgi:vacuolar-type H+-ATPase subunit I/STV1